MTKINDEQKQLLELIKGSLFYGGLDYSIECDWEKVYDYAKRQCIIALVEPVVPQNHKAKWTEEKLQIISRFVQLTYEQNVLINMFQEQGIPMVIIKGTAAAMYYPEPSLRTMGDIDFYVPPQCIPKAKELMKENGYDYKGENYRHYEYSKNNYEFEMHMQVSSISYNNVDHIFLAGMRNRCTYQMNNVSFPGLPPMENGLVLLGHMMQHLKGSGLGLRQVIDWMMFVHHELDDDAWEKSFRGFAKEAGLEKLAITMTFLCKKWLGLPNDITWCNDADEELADILLVKLLDDGNFGNARPVAEGVRLSIKKMGLFSYLQSSGMNNWRLAQKYSVFRPAAWIYQVLRLIRKWIEGVMHGKNELRGVIRGIKIEEIWKRLE